jgi:hypothetical protein
MCRTTQRKKATKRKRKWVTPRRARSASKAAKEIRTIYSTSARYSREVATISI